MAGGASPEHLSEVLRLCTALAYRALDARIEGQSMPAEQAVALAKTARLLQDYGVEWPLLLAQVLHELAGKAVELASRSESEPSEDDDLQGLTLFLSGFSKKDRA